MSAAWVGVRGATWQQGRLVALLQYVPSGISILPSSLLRLADLEALAEDARIVCPPPHCYKRDGRGNVKMSVDF